MRQRTIKVIILWAVILILSAIPSSANSAEAEYYRGIYDLCFYYGIKSGHKKTLVIDACKIYTAHIVAKDWFGQASPGWEWPLKKEETQ